MLSIPIGPFVLPVKLFLLIVVTLIAGGIGYAIAKSRRSGVGNALADMLLAGIVMARVVFVAQWFDVYRRSPWSILDIRDGGFTIQAGVLAALLVAALHCWRQPALRKPLAWGLTAGAVIWGVSITLVRHTENIPMPSVALQTLNGTQANLQYIANGKPAVVNLWATWCPPCRREMPILAAAQQSDQGIAFVLANQGEDAPAVRDYLSASKLSMSNVLLDPTRQLGREVGSRAFPTTLFYDAAGKLVDTHVGELSQASLADKLERLRAPSK